MSMKKKRSITVCHPQHGETEVKATSRLAALMAAAKVWDVFWVDIAKDATFWEGDQRWSD